MPRTNRLRLWGRGFENCSRGASMHAGGAEAGAHMNFDKVRSVTYQAFGGALGGRQREGGSSPVELWGGGRLGRHWPNNGTASLSSSVLTLWVV